MADLIQNVVEQIPYTIPWWQRLFKSWERAPERYYRRLNTIVDMFEWYCQDHALVYIQTMLPALGGAVLALLSFDWDDVARGFLRPSGPYARKSLVFDPRKAKWEWEIPELGEEIGKRIPGAKLIKPSKIWGKTRFLWVIDGLIQRVLYYFLIIDIVTEFLYNWSSAVLRALSECGAAYYARYGCYGDSGTEGWHQLLLGGFQTEVVHQPGPEAGFVLEGGWIRFLRPGAALFSYTLAPVFPIECRLRWRLVVKTDQDEIIDVSPWARSWREDEKTAMMVARVWKPCRIAPFAYIDYSTCYTMFQCLDVVAIKA
ncbi:MAG: hypothetical protein RQ897_13895 [Thermoflexus sp.]|nr:hypothetical protein [Thermoflexus sp.]MDT7949426.1 hypothetical protein [Thermoflexus sp.]